VEITLNESLGLPIKLSKVQRNLAAGLWVKFQGQGLESLSQVAGLRQEQTQELINWFQARLDDGTEHLRPSSKLKP
jgi:hypothetical protein